jgi:hypothetical protein
VVNQGDPSQNDVIGSRATGLLAPGAVTMADLNGDGIPDMVVANSGSNNVVVYPGLGNGQFGPALNGGHGFFTGTNPVSVTVADVNRDGRRDLVVANKGSNDVSILLNEPMAGGGITFMPGPRLHVGPGPVATVVQTMPGQQFPDIFVSVSGDGLKSTDPLQKSAIWILQGRGSGAFNDQNPTIIPLVSAPGPLFVGNFTNTLTPDLATLNPRTNQVTLISNLTGASPVTQVFSSGGMEPVSALIVKSTDTGMDNLLVANQGNGNLAFLQGGASGFILGPVQTVTDLPNPTALAVSDPQALAVSTLSASQLVFYGATEGVDRAFQVTFSLNFGATAGVPGGNPGAGVPGGNPGGGGGGSSGGGNDGGGGGEGNGGEGGGGGSGAPVMAAQLLPLSESSLALIGTLLTLTIDIGGASVGDAPTGPAVAAAPGGPSTGQSLPNQGTNDHEGGGGEPSEVAAPHDETVVSEVAPWTRYVIGLDEALQQLHDADHEQFFEGSDSPAGSAFEEMMPVGVESPNPTPPAAPVSGFGRQAAKAIDQAIGILWGDARRAIDRAAPVGRIGLPVEVVPALLAAAVAFGRTWPLDRVPRRPTVVDFGTRRRIGDFVGRPADPGSPGY